MKPAPDLIPNDRPTTATVNGAGLLAWGERAASGEVHLPRMIVKDNGVYQLTILWLDGRRLYRAGEQAQGEPERIKPLAPARAAAATQEAFKLFR